MLFRLCLSPQLTVLCLACLFFAQTASSKLLAADLQTGLWILSGQSNACGRAKLPGPKPNPQVRMFDPQEDTFVIAEDPLPQMGTVGVGPWVAAAQTVAVDSQSPIRMCGFASGGKPIAFWHPGNLGHNGLFPVIEKAGQGAEVFLWYQGESARQVLACGYGLNEDTMPLVPAAATLIGLLARSSKNNCHI